MLVTETLPRHTGARKIKTSIKLFATCMLFCQKTISIVLPKKKSSQELFMMTREPN
jgi:hypothetical protein